MDEPGLCLICKASARLPHVAGLAHELLIYRCSVLRLVWNIGRLPKLKPSGI